MCDESRQLVPWEMRDDPIPALKRVLADVIVSTVDCLGTTIAARVLDIDSARMSDLRYGRVERFSVERLIRLLAMVDRRVELTVVNLGPARLQWYRIMRERRAGQR